MDDLFDEEEAMEIISAIGDLCSKLGWCMNLVQADDDEGGIAGIILGSEEFIEELSDMSAEEVPDGERLH